VQMYDPVRNDNQNATSVAHANPAAEINLEIYTNAATSCRCIWFFFGKLVLGTIAGTILGGMFGGLLYLLLMLTSLGADIEDVLLAMIAIFTLFIWMAIIMNEIYSCNIRNQQNVRLAGVTNKDYTIEEIVSPPDGTWIDTYEASGTSREDSVSSDSRTSE